MCGTLCGSKQALLAMAASLILCETNGLDPGIGLDVFTFFFLAFSFLQPEPRLFWVLDRFRLLARLQKEE